MGFEKILIKKIMESKNNLESLRDMDSYLIAEGDKTDEIRIGRAVTYLSNVIKLYGYLQLYNENFSNKKMIEWEKDISKSIDEIQKILVTKSIENIL